MSEYSNIHAIAEKNKLAVDGQVNVTTEEWNTLLTCIEKIMRENKALKADRQNAISTMEKGWQHNADDYPDLLSRFVEMANTQCVENEKLRAENKELRSFLESLLVDVNEEIERQQLLNK